jgi:hypothetical protein
MNNNGPAILEIITDPKISADIYKKYLRELINN